MPGYVNHDVWKTRKKNPEIRLAEAINDMISAAVQKAKDEPKTATWIWDDKYDDDQLHALHCSHCGAIVEEDEQTRHNWYYCYHCGSKMTNPYGGRSETTDSDGASGRYLYQTERGNA